MITSDESRALVGGAGWIEQTRRGRLRFAGRDALTFLHAILTNDTDTLVVGRGTYALYLTPQGRLVADLGVHHRGDHLIADVPAAKAGDLAARLDASVFSEDVQIVDVTSAVTQSSVVGQRSSAVLASVFSQAGTERDTLRSVLDSLAVRAAVTISAGTWIARTDEYALPGFDIFSSETGPAIAERVRDAGGLDMPAEFARALRIEAGRPEFGVDMTEETIPLEAGLLERAISLTKGCFVGQEVIIRVLHRGAGRVAKRLVRIVIDAPRDGVPEQGTTIAAEGKEVGRITSAAWSVSGEHIVALGYVKREVADSPGALTIGSDEGQIVGLAG